MQEIAGNLYVTCMAVLVFWKEIKTCADIIYQEKLCVCMCIAIMSILWCIFFFISFPSLSSSLPSLSSQECAMNQFKHSLGFI